jgi:hypothetical protein
MKCKSCDTLLNDFETRRVDGTGEHYDLCSVCFSVSSQTVIEAHDDLYLNLNKRYNGPSGGTES